MNSSKVLVIGSNSFSGACFCAYLLNKGYDVYGTSRSQEPDSVFLPYRWCGSQSNFSFFQYDVNHHQDEIIRLTKRENIKHIVNFAAQSMVGQSWDHPEDWFQTNAVGLVGLQNKFRQLDFIERYIHVTTPEVYGSTSGFIKEDTPFNPSTPYAVSRASSDMNLKTMIDAYGFPAISTRAANVYGPGQRLYRIIPRMMIYIRLGKKLDLHGGGLSERSFIHMDDVSEATAMLLSKGTVGDTYHISTNHIVSIRELVEKICTFMGVDFDDHVNISKDRLGKDSAYLLNSEKIRSEVGWEDKVSLDQGLEACLKWVDENLGVLKEQPLSYIHKP